MAGAVADYGMIIKDYMAEQQKKRLLAPPPKPPVKVKEVTPEQHVKKADPAASRLIDNIPKAKPDLDKPKMTFDELAKKKETANLVMKKEGVK